MFFFRFRIRLEAAQWDKIRPLCFVLGSVSVLRLNSGIKSDHCVLFRVPCISVFVSGDGERHQTSNDGMGDTGS